MATRTAPDGLADCIICDGSGEFQPGTVCPRCLGAKRVKPKYFLEATQAFREAAFYAGNLVGDRIEWLGRKLHVFR